MKILYSDVQSGTRLAQLPSNNLDSATPLDFWRLLLCCTGGRKQRFIHVKIHIFTCRLSSITGVTWKMWFSDFTTFQGCWRFPFLMPGVATLQDRLRTWWGSSFGSIACQEGASLSEPEGWFYIFCSKRLDLSREASGTVSLRHLWRWPFTQ